MKPGAKYRDMSLKNILRLSRISFSKTGDFIGMGNWFRLERYTEQKHKVRKV